MAGTISLRQILPYDGGSLSKFRLIFLHDDQLQKFNTRNTWASIISKILPESTQAYECNLETSFERNFKWHTYLDKSVAVLALINEMAASSTSCFIFYCYGLSGLVLKKMMSAAATQPQYRDLLDRVTGIVFLGTPSFNNLHHDVPTISSYVAGCDVSTFKRAGVVGGVTDPVSVSSQFETFRWSFPVLTHYEMRPAKKRSFFTRSRFRSNELSRENTSINVCNEQFHVVSGDISSIFEQSSSETHKRIGEWLLKITNAARDRPVVHAQPEPIDDPSVRSQWSASMIDVDEDQFDLAADPKELIAPNSPTSASAPSSLPRPTPSLSPQNSMSPPDSSSFRTDSMSQALHSLSPQGSYSQGATPASPNQARSSGSFVILPAASDFFHEKCTVKLPCYVLKSHKKRNYDFQGRDDVLLAMDHKLLPHLVPNLESTDECDDVKTFSLCGVGGVGKTQTVVEFIHRRKSEFHAIFWVDADTKQKLELSFNSIAISLGLEKQDSSNDPVLTKGLVHGWLAEPHHAGEMPAVEDVRWLMVFDNAEFYTADSDTADMRNVLYDYWPREGRGAILTTCRDPSNSLAPYLTRDSVDMKGLDVEDAVILLQTLSKRHPSHDSADVSRMIVQELGCLPFAIVQIASYIRCESLTLAEFLNKYKEERERNRIHRRKADIQLNYDHTLANIWMLDNLSESSKSLLSIIALLDPDCIEEQVLTRGASEAELLDYPSDQSAYQYCRKQLTQNSLIQWDADQSTFSVHRIVQNVVAGRCKESGGVWASAFRTTQGLLSSMWPFASIAVTGGYPVYSRVDRWDQCTRMSRHISQLLDAFMRLGSEERRSCSSNDLVLLFTEVAWYFFERSNPGICAKFVQGASEAVSLCKETEMSVLATLESTQGALASNCGNKSDALKHARKLLEIHQSLSLNDSPTPGLAVAYSELGKALAMNGDYSPAIESFKSSARIRTQLPGFNRLALFSPLLGQGWVHWAMGGHEKAASFYLEALEDREAAFGKDDKQGGRTGNLLYGLGNALLGQGRLVASFSYHQRALLQYKATVGDSHSDTGDACYKVAIHHVHLRNYDKALALLEEAIRIFEGSSYYAPKLARVLFQRSRIRNCTGAHELMQSDAQRAWNIRNSLVETDGKSMDELVENDFDILVTSWSR